MSTASEKFESWAVIALFGHKQLAGKVTEANIGGGSFVRIDIPDKNGKIVLTKFVNPSAIYDITPCDENIAVAAAQNYDAAPVRKFELKALAGPGSLLDRDDEGYEEDGELDDQS